MHPALRILEVIDTVCSHAEHESLPALASTCRAFEISALNALWRNLQSVEPLVKCLPSDLFGINWTLQKPLDHKMWDTLSKYTSRVHSVTQSDNSVFIEPLSLMLLSCPLAASLFPRLRRLTWHADATRGAAEFLRVTFVRAFTNLIHLDIEKGCDISMSDEELYRLTGTWPKLQILRISRCVTIDSDTAAVPTFHGLMHLLRLCPALISLTLVIDTTKLDGIDLGSPGGELFYDHLKVLTLGNSVIDSPLNVALILSGLFPHLQQVSLGCWSTTPMKSLPQKGPAMEQWTLVNSFLCGFSVVRERPRRIVI